MHTDIFTELSVILAIAAVISIVMRLLRQPLIIGYIATGIIVGPSILGYIQDPEAIETFGKFGIALLLFVVGLGLNPRVIKEVGKPSILTGLGQVLFTTLIGLALVALLGYNTTTALYISVALAFSSTIIILKLLTDKKEHNSLYGKISIGFLLVQDVIATLALVVASATSGDLETIDIINLAGRGIVLIVGLILASRYVLKPTVAFLSRSQELLFLITLAWGFGIGALFAYAGFSLEIGALVAGISMAGLHYAQGVSSKLRPLRDFFIVIFFIALGATLNLEAIRGVFWHSVILSAFVLIGNPIIVMAIMGVLGYTKKVSFKAGLAVAQISEFSLIFVLLGAANGQVNEEAVSLVTIVALITIAISSYMIIYSDGLYKRLAKYLNIFERKSIKKEELHKRSYDALLVGYKKGGNEFVKAFKSLKSSLVVIDYDPDVTDTLDHKSIDYVYGDVNDADLLDDIDLSKIKIAIVTITDYETNEYVLKIMERANKKCVVICHCTSVKEAEELYRLGASYVMLPHYLGSEKISAFIKKSGFHKSEYRKFREQHLAYLHEYMTEEPSVD